MPRERTPIEQALRFLASRERTGKELERALARKAIPPEQRAAAMTRVRELGYLDDAEVARSRAARLVQRGESPRLAERRLLSQGVSREEAHSAVTGAAAGASEEELAARALQQRRRGRPLGDERERQRYFRALVQKGHRPSVVARVLKVAWEVQDGPDDEG